MNTGYINKRNLFLVFLLVFIVLGLGALPAVAHVPGRPNGQAQYMEPGQVPTGLTAADWDTLQEAYLKASNTAADDSFGAAVAVDGDTAVIGAPGEDSNATGVDGDQTDNSASDSGAAYVFVRTGGIWSQQAYLKASNTGANDAFGAAVAIFGDTLVVGASEEASNATGVGGNQDNNALSSAGAAYVFTRNGDVWSQQAYLKASNTDTQDDFGAVVAISGDTIVIAAPGEDSNATGVNGDQANDAASNAGAAYVFIRSGSAWSQQAYLKASNTEGGDYFGVAAAISGDTVVISANGEDSSATGVNGDQADNAADNAGAAYVFNRSGGAWSQQAYLKASNTEGGDYFGIAAAISGDTLIVGAEWEDSNATGVNGDQTDNTAYGSGAAYVFTRSGSAWSQQAYLKASNTQGGDYFGTAVAISGDTLVVGAEREDSSATGIDGNQGSNTASDSGAVYLFTRSSGVWNQQSYLKASNTDAEDYFGASVSVSGNALVVGALNEDSNATGVDGNQPDNSASNAGAAYVFGSGVMGATCTVDPGGSGTHPSIQAAVNDTSCGTIEVTAGTYAETVIIARSVILSGAGSGLTIVRGNNLDSVFSLQAPNFLYPIDVSLTQMTIQEGYADQGGGIYNDYASRLTVDDLIVQVNTATHGAGIYNKGVITITNSTIIGNYARVTGGGIFNGGSAQTYLTVKDSRITGNAVFSTSGLEQGIAGGIYTSLGATILNCTISNNGADADAGAIYAGSGASFHNDPIYIIDSVIEGNASGRTPGILLVNAPMIIEDTQIISNTGALTHEDYQYVDGGGIRIIQSGILTITNSIVSNNTLIPLPGLDHVYRSGAGIFVDAHAAKLKMKSTTVENNEPDGIVGNTLQLGPIDTSIFVTHSTIANNIGDGIRGLSNIEIAHSIIAQNSGAGIGYSGSTTVRHSIIRENGSFGVGSSDLLMLNSTVSGNTNNYTGVPAVDYPGGGVAGRNLEIRASTISDNHSASDGGGIYVNGSLLLVNSTISGNTADGNGGGIALVGSGATADLDSVTVGYNTADLDAEFGGAGGGIYRDAGAGTFSSLNSLIAENQDLTVIITGQDHDCYGSFTSHGSNLIGDYDGDHCTGFDLLLDQRNVDPLLQPLADWGGPTLTHAFLANSPAKNWHTVCPDFDQRGVARPQDGGSGPVYCDIGAYEAGVCLAPVQPTLAIESNGHHIRILWDEHEENREVEIWRGADPFAAGTFRHIWTNLSVDTAHIDYDAIGDPLVNNFYIVAGQDACGNYSDPSNRVGEFDFRLGELEENVAQVLAVDGVVRSLHFAMISLPLEGAGLPTTADGVADYIDPQGGVRGVAKWNPLTNSWVVRRVGSILGTRDFAVSPGDVLLLGMVASAPETFAWVGDVPAAGTIQNILRRDGANTLIVPLDQNGAFTMTADGLAANIGGVTHVGRWSAAEQRWYIRVVGQGGLDFPIWPGYAYIVVTDQSAPLVWP